MINLTSFIDEDGQIIAWPKKHEKKRAVLQYLAQKFEPERRYTEREVNAVIAQWHSFGDLFLLRRGMIEEKYLCRTRDGSAYWRNPEMEWTAEKD